MELTPYFLCGAPPSTNAGEAFIRVRVTQGAGPTGYIAVYLPTGTQLIVRGRDLLRFSSGAGVLSPRGVPHGLHRVRRPHVSGKPERSITMKIVVIGGTGLIGSKLVDQLRTSGHEAVAASPNSGVNTLTGEGLADALRGADVVVDVSNSPSWEDTAVLEFFETSTRNLLDAEAAAGVRHHVALSVVGTDRLADSGYFRAKISQEKLIKGSSIPYSIVHATQFFEFVTSPGFITSVARVDSEGDAVRVAPVLIQPMAADDVAAAVARVSTGAPLNGTVEVAGPDQFRLDELVRRALRARHDPRPVIADPHVPYSGAVVTERTLVPGDDAELGATFFDDWFDRSTTP